MSAGHGLRRKGRAPPARSTTATVLRCRSLLSRMGIDPADPLFLQAKEASVDAGRLAAVAGI